ncbi:protein translocase subunit SecD [Segniliparus rugosus]|uniref:Protein translocase subunit SecD n=1 Tax=Segniliparus rugosus (strain ATCC BAA-974 / DSM 45345 / CCUG 50838 / CIP 108380 / JCM 13579 / CDC 945) TaxID=679197 RepID=E5XT88_SEGRC|nr:protein translocase subunit SecD [Segniliparus rugosus]EFV12419.1 protein-export membrane protein SecD [Segniliparus rugosus ATCC BAA-974]
MPRRSRGMQPLQYLTVFVLFLAGLYSLVLFTGDKKKIPHLGIDLQSGTRVTLTARTLDGKDPDQNSLKLAKNIIEQRVNGLGVAGSEVLIQGSNLVITVPGEEGSQAKTLGQTARLYIRPVAKDPVKGEAMVWNKETAPDMFAPPPPPAPPANGEQAPPAGEPAPAGQDVTEEQAKEIQQARAIRQSPDVLVKVSQEEIQNIRLMMLTDPEGTAKLVEQKFGPLDKAVKSLDCSKPDPLRGNDDPKLPLVTCSTDGKEKLVLEPSIIDGQEISEAGSQFDNQRGTWSVSLSFKPHGQEIWSKYTEGHVGTQTAITLDSRVVSHPVIQGVINGSTQITGDFSATQARELANVLRYGSLPLSFSSSEAQTISATLGLASLRAGLIAGVVGLVLVLLYSLFYYRALGFLALLSLILTGVANYAVVVLLGRWIGFTLDLAGIAGFIIGIGMTADSFVVYFERIKDEVREGRSFRSAVPRAWERARRTILSGNAVTFIAAAVLYILAIGEVRGFAFTLGLTTIMDLVVVFLVTHPLVHAASTRAWWAKPSRTGLGRARAQAVSA